ncbi:MAG: (deoxy)nucleoside triphosphate pyrophosphohydrolase [Ignavibacteria bacterium]|nr:(deoxy)nucleoside triphosphate pyrophosphohydrolase [Ignavibacteria bacterium]
MTRVAVALLQKDGKVLLCQRKKGSRYGLKWEFPGGKLEPDESALDCLKRELREELSIEIQRVERVETHHAYYEDGGVFEVEYCFVSQFTGEPTNNTFEEIRWVNWDELRSLDILEGNKQFLSKLTR